MEPYFVGIYSKDDPDFLDGIEEGDIVMVFKKTPENIENAKKMFRGE